MRRGQNPARIRTIIEKFSAKYGVKVYSFANVGNHLHFHIQLSNRHSYRSFIRAVTGAIAMAVTGTSRWKKLKSVAKDRFWDYRPFTRVLVGFKSFLGIRDYVRINQLEAGGVVREEARWIVRMTRGAG